MKTPLIVSLGALGLSLVALAATLIDSAPSRARDRIPLEATPAAVDAGLLARLEALEEQGRALRGRLALLENRSAPGARIAIPEEAVSRAELEALQEEVRAALAALEESASGGLGASPSGQFTERVSAALAELRLAEATEQARRRVASRTEALSERMPWAADQLGLSWQQQTALESALAAMYERQENYGVLWASGEVAAKEDFGPIIESDMEAFHAQLSGFLSPGQHQSYLSLGAGGLFPGSGGGEGGK